MTNSKKVILKGPVHAYGFIQHLNSLTLGVRVDVQANLQFLKSDIYQKTKPKKDKKGTCKMWQKSNPSRVVHLRPI